MLLGVIRHRKTFPSFVASLDVTAPAVKKQGQQEGITSGVAWCEASFCPAQGTLPGFVLNSSEAGFCFQCVTEAKGACSDPTAPRWSSVSTVIAVMSCAWGCCSST